MRFKILLFLLCSSICSNAATLHVGAGHPYPNLSAAVADVTPGDVIMIHAGTYPGGLFFDELQGTVNQWITITNAPGDIVIFEGGSNAIQLSDPAYLVIDGLIFQHQTGNGVNIDDGGSYDTPAHHIIIEDCIFRDMNASGNNDLLKLSGLDEFEILNCTFLNGAAGGSGIDMVGCHQGNIHNNTFENLGSNSIQCKGGSAEVTIAYNFFRNGGQRTLNLGGSTGLQFFRPIDAPFEAGNLRVVANVFVGSWAPIAYVGAVNVLVANNTFYQPQNWVIRILQETVDTDRFLPCGNNSFINNIVWMGSELNNEVNIGPDTAPETFTFSNNLWYVNGTPNWPGPGLPVAEANAVLNQNPLFENAANDDFSIPLNSPATAAGLTIDYPILDMAGNGYATPHSIGAFEGNPLRTSVSNAALNVPWQVFPNPTDGVVVIEFGETTTQAIHLQVFNNLGARVATQSFALGTKTGRLDLSSLPGGVYWMESNTGSGKMVIKR